MSVLVLLEQRGELKASALEAATAAGKIAKAAGKELNAVYIGQALDDDVSQLKGFGIKTVYAYENDKLTHYSNDGYVPIVRDLANELNADSLDRVREFVGQRVLRVGGGAVGH
jgi:electron transfer flavoprotein alpha subunit